MNIPTPIPVQFCNHKGMKSNPIIQELDIQLYKASTLKSKLPLGLCVSGYNHCINFRFCWDPPQSHWSNHYYEIEYWPESGRHYYSGQSLNYNMHRSFMQTYEIVLPIAERVFNTGTFAKLAA